MGYVEGLGLQNPEPKILFQSGIRLLRYYEGHSVNSEIRYVSAITYLLAESWCCLYKAPTFISRNTKETIS